MLCALFLAALGPQDRTTWTFDEGPGAWRQVTYSGQAAFSVTAGGRQGACLTIESPPGADASWSFDAPVQRGSYYRLSGWVKTEGVTGAMGALLNVHQVAGAVTQALSGDTDWTRVETVFRTGDRTSVQINCLFGGWGRSTGRAYYDDVMLEKIDMQDLPGPVTIDVTKEREPISPYIYGQFIEHLGKCIYGGIWAEMLEDRKFYYPMDGAPPWQRMREGYDRLVASPWSKSSDTTVDFIKTEFRSTPVIELHGTITQRDVAVVPNKRYVLRLTYRGNRVGVAMFGDGKSVAASPFERVSNWTTEEATLLGVDAENGARFTITADGALIAAVSLMPADNIDGFRRDTIKLLKQLDAPIYRWPGGNFVSGYEWRDGIGDRDKRPTIPNPAWTGIDTNDVGTHEFIRFCELINTEPLIVVNTGFGDPFSAAQWVEYCNSPLPKPGEGVGGGAMAALRAQNGHPQPFNVRWWGVGNEMYGSWQLGHVPVAQYVTKHNMTVDRMKAVDPTIKTIAVGETGPWDEAMLRNTRHNMDLLSEHIYVQERQDTIEHTRLLPEAIRRKADWHRRFQPTLQQPKVKISMDEWNYWYGPYLYGELGTRYYWKDGMGVATGLHEFFRNTDVYEMAQYAQTVNVIGAIKTTPTHAEFETTGLVLAMYRKHFGTIPVSVTGINSDLGLDIVAALTADRKTLTIAVVNPFDREMTVLLSPLPLAAMHRAREEEGAGGWRFRSPFPLARSGGGRGWGMEVKGNNLPTPSFARVQSWVARIERGKSSSAARTSAQEGRVYTIAHPDPRAYNEPGKPRALNVKQSPWLDTTKLTLPAHSVTIARVGLN